MKLKKLELKNIGGIKHTSLEFNSHINIICGKNGIGKSTILKSILSSIPSTQTRVKPNVDSDGGEIIFIYDELKTFTVNISNKSPADYDYIHNRNEFYIPGEIIFFDTERNIDYKKLKQIKLESELLYSRENSERGHEFSLGVKLDNIKDWFLMLALHAESKNVHLSSYQFNYFNVAISALKMLSSGELEYDYIDYSTNEILLKDIHYNNPIVFEYLSSGYKSCIYIIWGIIKEIKERFDNRLNHSDHGKHNIKEFDGIIIIDEIDLHLHPVWQGKIIGILSELFPDAQFIISTHSPSVLQNLSKSAIIPLSSDDKKIITVNSLDLSEYGLQGWTFEEILLYVMGNDKTESDVYVNYIEDFIKFVKNRDKVKAQQCYSELKKMLHPSNPQLALLEYQLKGVLDD